MRLVDETTPARGKRVVHAAGMAAWTVLAAHAAGVQGVAQNSAPATQEQRTGVAKPAPARITPADAPADPQEDTTPLPAPAAAKPSAAVPVASGETVYGPYVPYHAPGATAATSRSSAAYDPDAHIVGDAPAVLARHDDAAKSDPDAGIVTHLQWLPNEIPDGVLVKVKLLESISTETTKPGSLFSAEIAEPVVGDGRVYLPAGSVLKGRVTWAHGGSRLSGGAAIHLEPRTVTLPDGTEYAMHARVIDTSSWDNTKVDSEGTILRKDHAKETVAAMGLATGGGAAAGAMIGGVPGALIGAGVGAGASVVVWLKENRQAVLPKDLGVVFSLTMPMSVAPRTAGTPGGE